MYPAGLSHAIFVNRSRTSLRQNELERLLLYGIVGTAQSIFSHFQTQNRLTFLLEML